MEANDKGMSIIMRKIQKQFQFKQAIKRRTIINPTRRHNKQTSEEMRAVEMGKEISNKTRGNPYRISYLI